MPNTDTFRRVFREAGIPQHVADAAIANFIWESGGGNDINTGDQSGDGGRSWGAAQWNGDRLNALRSFASQRGTSWNDPETQALFTIQEWQGTERAAYQAALATTNARDATQVLMSQYERPNPQSANLPGRLAALESLGYAPTPPAPVGAAGAAASMAAGGGGQTLANIAKQYPVLAPLVQRIQARAALFATNRGNRQAFRTGQQEARIARRAERVEASRPQIEARGEQFRERRPIATGLLEGIRERRQGRNFETPWLDAFLGYSPGEFTAEPLDLRPQAAVPRQTMVGQKGFGISSDMKPIFKPSAAAPVVPVERGGSLPPAATGVATTPAQAVPGSIGMSLAAVNQAPQLQMPGGAVGGALVPTTAAPTMVPGRQLGKAMVEPEKQARRGKALPPTTERQPHVKPMAEPRPRMENIPLPAVEPVERRPLPAVQPTKKVSAAAQPPNPAAEVGATPEKQKKAPKKVSAGAALVEKYEI